MTRQRLQNLEAGGPGFNGIMSLQSPCTSGSWTHAEEEHMGTFPETSEVSRTLASAKVQATHTTGGPEVMFLLQQGKLGPPFKRLIE